MRILPCIVILILLVSAMVSYGAEEEAAAETERASPKDWRDSVLSVSTAVLAFFTFILALAAIYYARQTRSHVRVSKQLLESNNQLISLGEAQNSIAKAQLLSKVDELAVDRTTDKGFVFDPKLSAAICIYLSEVARDLLGEDFKRKVTLKFKGGSGTKNIFGIPFEAGEPQKISAMIWEQYKKAVPEGAALFDVVEDTEPE